MRDQKQKLKAALLMLAAFGVWTVIVRLVDVQAIGPQGSRVGLATLNGWMHRWTGVHLWLYHVTDGLSLVPVATGLGFAALGVGQWVQRKHLCRVDRDLFVLAGFYLLVLLAYLAFEVCIINVRPVLLEGRLEASYPSSTTVLVLCVMATACLQLQKRIRHRGMKRILRVSIAVYSILMVAGRLISGVHWLTDIIGGVLLSAGLILLYAASVDWVSELPKAKHKTAR